MSLTTNLLTSTGEASIPIQGNLQYDGFGLTSPVMTGSVGSTFSLILNDQNIRIQCRVAFGLSPGSYSLIKIGTVVRSHFILLVQKSFW